MKMLKIGFFLIFAMAATAAEPTMGEALPLDATQVRLLPGSPFAERQELHRTGYLASFDPDRLLTDYRALAKLPQPTSTTTSYDGWDRGFIRGHMAGHYLSAASRMAAATGDAEFRRKANYLVTQFAACQRALGLDGYLAAFPPVAFDHVEGRSKNSGGVVVPYYTYHKILAGLLDAYHYLGNREALTVAEGMAGWVERRLATLTPQQLDACFHTDRSRNPPNEFGGMADALARLAELTGNARWLALAKQFNRGWFIEPLVAGEDHLAGLHANTHLAQVVGIAHRGRLAHDERELNAARAFWTLVTTRHSFVIGGNSFKEWFDAPGVEAGPCIHEQRSLPPTTAESCNTQNMLSLTQQLFAVTPRATYAAFIERALTNHLLATIAPDSGRVTYFLPLGGHFRTYLTDTFCCVGTGIENTARYNEQIYAANANQLWVNLFIPSRATWTAGGLVLRQEGFPPVARTVRLTIEQGTAQQRTLSFRVPGWLNGPFAWALNGVTQPTDGVVDGYLSVRRTWTAGDTVELTLPAGLRLEHAMDRPNMVAVLYGPVLLAGALGRDGMGKDTADKDAHLKLPPASVPAILHPSDDPAAWLEPVDRTALTYRVHGAGPADGIVFMPLYALHHERYAVYWPRTADAAIRSATIAVADPRQVDRVQFGDAASEQAHDVRRQGGELTAALVIQADQQLELVCDYGAGVVACRIELQVNGVTVATDDLAPGAARIVRHLLPPAALVGQQNLSLRIQGADAAALTRLRVVTVVRKP